MNKYINSREIIDRVIEITGWTKTKIAKDIFDIDLSNLGNRTRGDRLDFYKLLNWALHTGVNIEWLVTGGQDPGTSDTVGVPCKNNSETAELLEMTRQVVQSDTTYGPSLKANIRSSYQALEAENRLQNLEKRVKQIEEGALIKGGVSGEGQSYSGPERRKGERRQNDDPSAIPGEKDRRSSTDRRVSG